MQGQSTAWLYLDGSNGCRHCAGYRTSKRALAVRVFAEQPPDVTRRPDCAGKSVRRAWRAFSVRAIHRRLISARSITRPMAASSWMVLPRSTIRREPMGLRIQMTTATAPTRRLTQSCFRGRTALGTVDDIRQPLNSFQRQITLSPVFLTGTTTVNNNLRLITVTVRYTCCSLGPGSTRSVLISPSTVRKQLMNKIKKSQQGLSLMEALVAMLVASIVLAAGTSLVTKVLYLQIWSRCALNCSRMDERQSTAS